MNNDRQIADGFRLDRLEVYNWGTFHDQIYTFRLDGQTALLTGSNGSGKSTLVDALLTLLVAPRSRIYNEASGGLGRKRERDEMTYVRGDYGRIRDEYNGARIQSLRDHSSYTVILAVFCNLRQGKTVSIAQVMWMQEGERIARKQHVIAQRDLNIRDHFGFNGDTRQFKAQMRKLNAEVIDKFSTYSQKFRALAGVRSEKALDLFRQIIGIKEIDNLTTFLRDHMLEPLDVEGEIEALRQQYDDLITALNAIEQDEKQLDMLQPMIEEMDKHTRQVERYRDFERAQQAVPFYFALRKADLLEQEERQSHERLRVLESELARVTERYKELDKQKTELDVAIRTDNVGQQLAQLQQTLEIASKQQSSRKSQALDFDKRAGELGLPKYNGDPAVFHQVRSQAEAGLKTVSARQATLQSERDEARDDVKKWETRVAEGQYELDDLRQRKSQIPSEDLRVRERLASALKLNTDEFPFIGELVRVREDQRDWEGAIERLLRGFARQMLVPDDHYRAVSRFVNQNNLRGRLVYFKVEPAKPNTRLRHIEPNSVPAKLELKTETVFHTWLHNRIGEQFDYACVESIDDFQRQTKAITREGQIRHTAERHEKDDRHNINDRTKFVLGWDNRAKIEALENALRLQQKELANAQMSLKRVEQEQRSAESELRKLQGFLSRFEDFAQIDWLEDQKRIAQLQIEINALKASSERLKALELQLESVKQRLAETDNERRQYDQQIGSVESTVERLAAEFGVCRTLLERVTDEIAGGYALIESRIKDRELSLTNIGELQTNISTNINKQLSALNVSATEISNRIVSQMTDFRARFAQTALELGHDMGACEDYRRLAKRISFNDLPKHRKRFEDLLNRNMLNAFVAFRTKLRGHSEEIRESIKHLNEALKPIEYTPTTYIELQLETNRDQEIRLFRQELDDAVNAGDDDPDGYRDRFSRIKILIERFTSDTRWRAKVTDVRNWFTFAAEERYRLDSSVKEYHNDTSGKSGGQKAKLAYTIMASAIAYQYGLDNDDRRSNAFRFVVVDEAFSKSDESNARFAMELFKTLGLQLLVVTPLDKIQVVDPYIETCRITVNNAAAENDSRLYMISAVKLREERERIQQGGVPL